MWSYMRGSALNGLGMSLQAKREFEALRTYIETHVPDDDLLAIASASLEGEIKQSEGDLEGAISAFRTATSLEDALPYAEPPVWPLPVRRFLGAALLASGLAAEAEGAYSRDLAWNQNNGWSLYGLWQSLQMQDRTREAEAARSRFEEAWQQADVTLNAARF